MFLDACKIFNYNNLSILNVNCIDLIYFKIWIHTYSTKIPYLIHLQTYNIFLISFYTRTWHCLMRFHIKTIYVALSTLILAVIKSAFMVFQFRGSPVLYSLLQRLRFHKIPILLYAPVMDWHYLKFQLVAKRREEGDKSG